MAGDFLKKCSEFISAHTKHEIFSRPSMKSISENQQNSILFFIVPDVYHWDITIKISVYEPSEKF